MNSKRSGISCSLSFRFACVLTSVPSQQATTSAIQCFIMMASSAPLSPLQLRASPRIRSRRNIDNGARKHRTDARFPLIQEARQRDLSQARPLKCFRLFRPNTQTRIRRPWNDVGYSRPAHRNRTVKAEFLPRLIHECRGGPAFPSEQAVNRVRTQVALMPFIAEQCFAVAPPPNKCCA